MEQSGLIQAAVKHFSINAITVQPCQLRRRNKSSEKIHATRAKITQANPIVETLFIPARVQ